MLVGRKSCGPNGGWSFDKGVSSSLESPEINQEKTLLLIFFNSALSRDMEGFWGGGTLNYLKGQNRRAVLDPKKIEVVWLCLFFIVFFLEIALTPPALSSRRGTPANASPSS